jgi:hypothetical protein
MKKGTREIYIDVRHHPKHMEEYPEFISEAHKMVEQANPHATVALALRNAAERLSPEPDYEALCRYLAEAAKRYRESTLRGNASNVWVSTGSELDAAVKHYNTAIERS